MRVVYWHHGSRSIRKLFLVLFTLWVCQLSSSTFADVIPHYRGVNVVSPQTAEDILALEQLLKPNTIRYTLHNIGADVQSKEEYFSWLSTELDNLDNNLLPVLNLYGTKVILNVGSPPGGFASRTGKRPQLKIFTDKSFQDALSEMWTLLANRYKDNTSIVAFHLLSEPAIGSSPAPGLMSWYELQSALITTVRAIDVTHTIIVTPEYSAPQKLSRITLPANSGSVWYCINMYYPTSFLRQGVEIAPYKTNYPSEKANKEVLLKYLKNTIKFVKKNKVKLYVSEFTTTRFGPKNSSVRYLKDIISIFNKNGWEWTYHAWRESDAWSLELPALEDKDPTVPTKRAVTLKRYVQ